MHISGGVSAGLFILEQEERQYAFISHAGLAAHVVMDGGIRVTWDKVMATAGQAPHTEQRPVQQFILAIHTGQGMAHCGNEYHIN